MLRSKTTSPVTYTNKELRGGAPLFKGTTIPVYMVLDYLAKGWSVEDMKNVYPTIKQKYIYKVLENLAQEQRH